MNAKLLLCLAALPAAVDALGEFHAEEVKTTCPTLVPRANQTNTAGSLMSTGTVAVLDSDYQGSDKPAVIVVQEWWGLNEEHIKKAQKIAEAGYRVLVPTSTRVKSASTAEEANHLMSELDFPTAVQEICTIAKWAKDTGAQSVGVTGFCMGRAVSRCARSRPRRDRRGRAVLRLRTSAWRLLRHHDVDEKARALVERQARQVRRLL